MNIADPQSRVRICQYGTDGFGHQFEGTLRLIHLAISGIVDYEYNIKRTYIFEHQNFTYESLIAYIQAGYSVLNGSPINPVPMIMRGGGRRTFQQIMNDEISYRDCVYAFDGLEGGQELPINFRPILTYCPRLREAFVDRNPILPPPSFLRTDVKNVVCHLRLNDAVNTRTLDTGMLVEVVKHFQQKNNAHVTIHSDGDIAGLASDNTTLKTRETDVLHVLSDFIHADVLIINYSGLSLAAHLLGKEEQVVIIPTRAGVTFPHRILSKCIRCDDFLAAASSSS